MPPLPPALSGDPVRIGDETTGPLQVYVRGRGHRDAPPVLLVHSVNAAASAYEMRPVWERLSPSRPTYAFDLPGFGHSDRSDRKYSPRLMTDAIHHVVAWMRARHDGRAVDALALSLSCEFLARAASEEPPSHRTVALESPTGMDGRGPYEGPPGRTRGKDWVRSMLGFSLWDDALYDNLTRPKVVRYFLERTWGSKDIDEGLWEYAVKTAAQPGAKHAPLWFLSGHLFSKDVGRVYDALKMPVWMTHGIRGDFTDYRGASRFEDRWRIDVYDSGAIPHFEHPEKFADAYERFLAAPGDSP